MDAAEQKCYVISMQTARGVKYYVGKSQNVLTRANEHATGMGSAWTKKFHIAGAIFDIIEVIPCADKFTEDNTTKEYMSKHGIENVRGGSYANIVLTEDQIMALNRELATSNDSCFNCGKQGHFSGDCKIAKVPQKTAKSAPQTKRYPRDAVPVDVVCYRCGRPGHTSPECFAQTDINGAYIGKK